MRKIILPIAIMLFIPQFSLAIAADPNIRQAPAHPMAPPRSGSIPQIQLTPDLLYQEINALKQQNSALTQQIQILQGQVNTLQSVVQVSATGTTILAENLSLNAGKTLTMSSGLGTNLTTGGDLDLSSGKTVSLQGGKDVTVEGAGKVKLKAPQINMNDGNKGIALQDSPVAGGKVISGSTSVFAK